MSGVGDQIRIDYDDDPLAVVDKINGSLKANSLVIVDDGLSHEGYCLFALQAVKSSDLVDQIRIDYDDDQLNVIEKINSALRAFGLVLVDDGLSHEGYCLFTLVIS